MSSSDSDDDCYGNVARRLQAIKNKFMPEKVSEIISIDASDDVPLSNISSKNNETVVVLEDCDPILNSTDNDELTLDAIIAKNTKTKPGRRRKPVAELPEPIYEVETRSSGRKTNNSRRGRNTATDDNEVVEVESPKPKRGRGRGRGKSTAASSNTSNTPRGRKRGATRGSTPARGASTSRGRKRYPARENAATNIYPTYNIGNTHEYPDLCNEQQLFSTKSNDVEIINDDDDDPLDNEELSVKVFWQSLKVFPFKIRRYQKLSQIFLYFSQKENVGNENLLFMYNNKIIKSDDTPDTINYSIAKFIEGGIVKQNISELVKQNNDTPNTGLKIKFQCQNLKKPFETNVNPDERLGLAMMKCAEHMEVTLEKLKFYFDGDVISSKSTPKELDLEGGECIDVKIIS